MRREGTANPCTMTHIAAANIGVSEQQQGSQWENVKGVLCSLSHIFFMSILERRLNDNDLSRFSFHSVPEQCKVMIHHLAAEDA